MGLDGLRAEHRRLLGSLPGILTGTSGPAEQARFAGRLARHLELEEHHLVPLLSTFLPRDTGPLAVLAEDHGTIRQALADLAATRTAAAAGRLADLLRQHFAKEEELLYLFAETHLSPEDLARFEPPSSPTPPGSAKSDDR